MWQILEATGPLWCNPDISMQRCAILLDELGWQLLGFAANRCRCQHKMQLSHHVFCDQKYGSETAVCLAKLASSNGSIISLRV